MRKTIILEWIRIIIGLFIFSFGVHLTIFANIGLAPWDCLGMGLPYHLPLNYGLCMTLVAVTILLIDILLKEKIGYGTIIDALFTGNFVQFFNSVNPFPLNKSLAVGIAIMLAGFVFMALGMAVCSFNESMLRYTLISSSGSVRPDINHHEGGLTL